MLTISEMRSRLNVATEGALWALNMAAKVNNLVPHVWVVPGKGPTRVLFWATNQEGRTEYFDSALMESDPSLEGQLKLFLTMREAKNKTVQIHNGLARLARGLDPEDMWSDPSRD
jgi:hypothetical protein